MALTDITTQSSDDVNIQFNRGDIGVINDIVTLNFNNTNLTLELLSAQSDFVYIA